MEYHAMKAPSLRVSLFSCLFISLFWAFFSQGAITLLYTIIVYFISHSGIHENEFGTTVHDVSSQFIFITLATASLAVASTLFYADRALYRSLPFWASAKSTKLNLESKSELWRGISSGLTLPIIFIFVFVFSRQVTYLGLYLTSAIGTPAFPLFFVNFFGLFILVVCEEFIFRHKILRYLSQHLSPFLAILVTGIIYIAIKSIQFTLEWSDLLNLMLLNVSVGFFFLKHFRVHRGLGFLLSFYLSIHSICGLPLWGVQSPSLFLFKVSSKSSTFLSGGSLGPLAGLGITSILFFSCVGSYMSWKPDRRKPQKV